MMPVLDITNRLVQAELAVLLIVCCAVGISQAKPLHEEGCPEGLRGEDCLGMCSPGCLKGCHRITGKCLEGCKPGWFREFCGKMCPDHRYGHNCQQTCGQCLEDQPCNIVTGVCGDGCAPGWNGEKCREGCPPFTYGFQCSQSCGHCHQNKTCNKITGVCSAGCARGWLGEKCQDPCREGEYGNECQEKCHHCAGNSTCHHVTGVCADGCADGWDGELCYRRCDSNHYGANCRQTCGFCQKGSCDHVTGECHGGCAKGYHGTTCKAECPRGMYGANCSQTCGMCKAASCNREDGICRRGCLAGWEGTHCLQNCTPGLYGPNCKLQCGQCMDGGYCDIISGKCPSGCADGWEGERCDAGVLKVRPAFHSTPTFPIVVICLIAVGISVCSFFTYFVCVRPRKTALRRLYTDSNSTPNSNTYEQVVGTAWQLHRGQLTLGNELLGNGQFGNVKKGHVKVSGVKSPVAIKSLKENASEKDKEDFLNEFDILKRVGKHENVVCLVGACHIRGVMYVAMEYAKHGDLRTFLRHSRRLTSLHEYDNTTCPTLRAALRPQTLISLALGTAKGLRHLCDQQIIHRDVAARNVLLGDKLVPKIADFGLSKNDQTYVKTSSTRVPIRWMAVESLFNNTYTLQSDVWSFGVLLWEIFTLGGTPYAAIDSQQLFTYLKDGHRLRKPRLCEQDMYAMMLQCWNDSPERRPVMGELVARLHKMLEKSQVYINLSSQEEALYAEIDHGSDQ